MLKVILPLAVIGLGGAAVLPQQNDGLPVGTVVYSVLDYTEFTEDAPGMWVPLAGNTQEGELRGTELCVAKGFCSLPDARGLFIRVHNQGRDDGRGDPDGERPVGGFQEDMLKSHNHANGGFAFLLQKDGSNTHKDLDSSPGEPNLHTVREIRADGGEETRPRNIALYAYIKVGR
jgi:hypothetical protein